MKDSEKVSAKRIIGSIENIHLFRKLFIKRSTSNSDLHFSQVAIMRTIQQNENCTQATIAEKLRVTPASVAISTKRLEKAGLITKTVDKNNLRCKRLALTEKGRVTIDTQKEYFETYDKMIFKNFTEAEMAQFFGYLDRLVTEMKIIEGLNENTDSPFELTMLLHRIVYESLPSGNDEKNNL